MKKKMKIFSCLCIYDSLFSLTSNEIVKMVSTPSDLSTHIIIIEKLDNFYIRCRDTIVFCYEYQMFGDDNYATCATILHPVSCFDLIPYSFSNICETCTELLTSVYFFDNLVKVKDE